MNLCVDSRLFRMRRLLLNSRNHEDQDNEIIDTTPSRWNSVRCPRLRLLDKISKSDDVLSSVASSYPSTLVKQAPEVVKTYSLKIPHQPCWQDRFIRNKFDKEAAHYLLTKKTESALRENELDVFKQVESLPVKWRKQLMHQLMAKENTIPGLRQKEVLRGSHLSTENKLPGSLAGRPKVLWDEEHFEDGIWKSKPRNRPLIGVMDSMLDMPGFRTLPRYRSQLVDWGSNNVIAAVIQGIITFYDTRTSDVMEPLENVEIADACAVKWNHAGNKTIVCTLSSEIKLYCLETQKIVWTVTCKCVADYNVFCFVSCICWSQNDQNVVTGCKGFITVYSVKDGTVINSIHAHATKILALAFSPNYVFLVSSASDMDVRIFQWPSLSAYLDITYYEPVIAMAWHPYQNGYLCIGGGVGDASLSLWNVNKLNPANYRHVDFHGAVENLAWNKHSGELIVHWSYWEGHKRYNVIPVLTSLDRIVDAIPVEKELQVNAIMWNPDHTQLGFLEFRENDFPEFSRNENKNIPQSRGTHPHSCRFSSSEIPRPSFVSRGGCVAGE